MKKAQIKWKSLQPGFLYGIYDRSAEIEDLFLPTHVWKAMQAKGFYGGMFIPEGVDLVSLSEKDLAKLGLRRIQ